MDNQKLADKLRKTREALGYSQEYMGAKLGMTQSGYSWIEMGKTRITPSLLKELKSIENLENFDEPTAGEVTNRETPNTLAGRWRWGKPLLYVTVVVIGALVLEKGFSIGEEFYRGWSGETKENEGIMAIVAVIYFLSGVGFIYWLVFRTKWKQY